MERVDQELGEIFKQLKECHSAIHQINKKPHKKQLIYKLHESCELCLGVFYHLNMYQHFYNDLDSNQLNKLLHTESWDILDNAKNYTEFAIKSIPPSNSIHFEFRSMCIANAAFRLSSAGALICCTIQESKKRFRLNKAQYNKFWPFQNYLKGECDWNRGKIYNDCKNADIRIMNSEMRKNLDFLLLLIALRDEYGHSEYSLHSTQEYREKRGAIIDKHY
jgi:hypothetical protein